MDRDATTTSAPVPGRPADEPAPYQPPRVVRLGAATDLMQRDGTGHLIDGTGGWWVWGS